MLIYTFVTLHLNHCNSLLTGLIAPVITRVHLLMFIFAYFSK